MFASNILLKRYMDCYDLSFYDWSFLKKYIFVWLLATSKNTDFLIFATGRYLNVYITRLEKENRYKPLFKMISQELVFYQIYFTLLLLYKLETQFSILFKIGCYDDYKTIIRTCIIRQWSITQQAFQIGLLSKVILADFFDEKWIPSSSELEFVC